MCAVFTCEKQSTWALMYGSLKPERCAMDLYTCTKYTGPLAALTGLSCCSYFQNLLDTIRCIPWMHLLMDWCVFIPETRDSQEGSGGGKVTQCSFNTAATHSAAHHCQTASGLIGGTFSTRSFSLPLYVTPRLTCLLCADRAVRHFKLHSGWPPHSCHSNPPTGQRGGGDKCWCFSFCSSSDQRRVRREGAN